MLSSLRLGLRKSISLNSKLNVRHGSEISVILLQNLLNRGESGQIVKVKRGFARNFLIPKKIAAYGTDANKVKYADLIQSRLEAKPVIDNTEFVHTDIRLERAATESGGLFGSVTVKDIKEFFEEKQVQVKDILIENDVIKALGSYVIRVDGRVVNLDVVAAAK